MGFSEDTVRYYGDTVRIQRGSSEDTVRIQGVYNGRCMRNQRHRHLEFDKDNVLLFVERLVTVYISMCKSQLQSNTCLHRY